MKIVKNEATIERNKKVGNWISVFALLVLGGGMYISFSKPDWFAYSILCLVVGYLLTQVGMYMGNRWGRSPRPDEKLDAGLKGLHSEFTLYHYVTPASHLLVGPAGIWTLLPYHQAGKVEFVKNRWKLSGGGFFQNYMRIFGQEGLGRPDLEANSEVASVKKFLDQKLSGQSIPEVQALLVFTNEAVELMPNDAPVPALKLKQMKEFLRQKSKERALAGDQLREINNLLSSN
ncbi:MAG: hypothetical protein IT310_09990 [Anaerolineales bacterium]|nr:hypothetical protein [Anaerolineales bacterium]